MNFQPLPRSRWRGIGAMLAVVIVGLAFASTAEAYIDPGTGSLLLQGVLAAIASIAVAAGVFWERIKSFLRPYRRTSRDDDGGTPHPDSDAMPRREEP